MQLQCNTKDFHQLQFGKVYECVDAWTQNIRKNKYEMVEVQLTPYNTQRFNKEYFLEIDEQTKDLIQNNPIDEIDPNEIPNPTIEDDF